MELKLRYAAHVLGLYHCFNRTFMELKQSLFGLFYSCTYCFNRTFMELKHVLGVSTTDESNGFNRTFMELKRFTAELSKLVELF